MSVRVEFRWDEGLLARVDAAKGVGQPRADWVRRAVEQALGVELGDAASPGARVRSREVAPPAPAPAEQLGAVEQTSVTGVGGGSPGVSRADLPASAERPYRQHVPGPNVESIRSSGQAKRGVGPVPKGER